MLVLAAALWGLGTVAIKDTVGGFPPSWLVGIRFTVAGIITCVLFGPRLAELFCRRRLLDHLRCGFVLGALVACAYLMNTNGLTDTTAAKSSFLTGAYCVLVPFQAWVLTRVKPTAYNLTAGFICLAGIGLVALPGNTWQEGLSLGYGDAITIGSAFFLGLQVVATSAFAKDRDIFALTAFQFLIGGFIALAFGAATEPWPTLDVLANPVYVRNVAYITIVATCVCLLLQNVGLKHVTPSSGALLLSTESLFGVLFSVLLLGENLTSTMVCGFALIFLAVLISEWLPYRTKR